MKNKLTFLFCAIFITFSVQTATGQIFGNDPEIKIDGLAPESVWQIAELAMNDNSIPIGQLNIAEGVLMSDWIQWTAIAIKNHARLYLKYESPTLILKIADRQYQSDKGWAEAVGNISKKNYKLYVQDLADRITAIKNDEALTKKAIKTSKLFPVFNPVNEVDGLVWTLLKTEKPENKRPILYFTVKNTSPNDMKIWVKDTRFLSSIEKTTSSLNSDAIWARYEDKKNITTLKAGETLDVQVKFFNGGHWDPDMVPKLWIKIIGTYSGKDHDNEFNIYQIPLVGYVFNPDEA